MAFLLFKKVDTSWLIKANPGMMDPITFARIGIMARRVAPSSIFALLVLASAKFRRCLVSRPMG